MTASWTPPVAGVVTPEAVRLEFETAGVPTRALARVIDLLLAMAVVSTVMSFVAALAVSATGALVVGLLIVFLVLFAYPVACELLMSGRSPGKILLNLRVVTVEGGPVRFRHSAIRAAMQLVDFLVVPIGVVAVISALAGRSDQRLGDRLAGTIVVRSTPVSAGSLAMAFPPLPGLEGYVASLDVTAVTAEQYEVLRSFLTRVGSLSTAARARLATRLADPIAAAIAHTPPPSMHPEHFLASVASAYQYRHGGPVTYTAWGGGWGSAWGPPPFAPTGSGPPPPAPSPLPPPGGPPLAPPSW